MPIYRFRGRDAGGNLVEGEMEADSEVAVATFQQSQGVIPTEIVEKRGSMRRQRRNWRQELFKRRPNLDDLILFTRQMYTLMRSGVPITRALAGLAESTRNVMLSETLVEILGHLEAGRELSSAMARFTGVFPSLYVSIVRVGESTGRLDEAFLQLTGYMERERDIRDRLKQALRYPALVLVAITAALTVINIFVIPAFKKLFGGFHAKLPWQTQLLIDTSDFFLAFWPYVLGGLVVVILGIRSYIKTDQGRYLWDRLKLRLPVLGKVFTEATLARFSYAFALSLRAGVPMVQILGLTGRAMDNEFLARRIQRMREGVERGDPLSRTAASSGMFPPMVIQMIAVGEETGSVDEMLGEVAGYYDREVDYDLKTLSAAVEPILTLFIGGIVLVLALGIFLPMWDLAHAAGLH